MVIANGVLISILYPVSSGTNEKSFDSNSYVYINSVNYPNGNNVKQFRFQADTFKITFLWADDDADEMKRIVVERFPEYQLQNETICGTINIIEFSAMFTILHMTCPITPVYITIWILRKKIIENLTSNSKDMSSKTKEMHKQLLKVWAFG